MTQQFRSWVYMEKKKTHTERLIRKDTRTPNNSSIYNCQTTEAT